MDHRQGKSWRAEDLYSIRSSQERFRFLCFLNRSMDLSLIYGYKKLMKIVLDKHPVLEDGINLCILRVKSGNPTLDTITKFVDGKKGKFTKNGLKQYQKHKYDAGHISPFDDEEGEGFS